MILRLALLTAVVALFVNAQEAPDVSKVTKAMLKAKMDEERRTLAESLSYVQQGTRGLVETMKDHVRLALLNDLQQQVERSVEAAEDALVKAEDEGRHAEACVTPLEEAARQLGKDGIERLRECVEEEAAEGRRLQDRVAGVVAGASSRLRALDEAVQECLGSQDADEPEGEAIDACFAQEAVKQAFAAHGEAMQAVARQNDAAREKLAAGNSCLAGAVRLLGLEFDALRASMAACADAAPAPREEL